MIMGKRYPDGSTIVTLNGRELHASGKHSYDLEWGYGGSGPAETAWVILSTLLDREVADHLYQEFKWDVIARLPRSGWQMSIQEVFDWVNEKAALPV